MSLIRSSGNKTTESKLRLALVRNGVRGWTLHRRDVFGTPDFYFQKQKLAIFVDGCFWHGCLKCGHIPKTRKAFWSAKFQRNQDRARTVKRILSGAGIRTLRVWEHELKESCTAVDRIKTL